MGAQTLVGTVNGPDYAARAAAGAVFLDGQLPSWPWEINLATLALCDTYYCVLGQLGGTYCDMSDRLGLMHSDAERLGFTLNDAAESLACWAMLDDAWAREIVTRRETAETAPPPLAGPAGGTS